MGRWRRTGGLTLIALGGLAAISILGCISPSSALAAGPAAAPTAVHAMGMSQPLATATTNSALDLSITASPSAICANQDTACSAGTGQARVTLSASAGGSGQVEWPAVQVAFVIETTVYDGVYHPPAYEPGEDYCADQSSGASIACEESNGVDFFMANAQSIASAIAAANPHTTVSFALVDYFATLNNWDDGDGAEYHVDIPQFVPSSEFGGDVKQTLQQNVMFNGCNNWCYDDSDFSDNFLHSSSITALYGTIIGSGLDWANDTHHVIVWMGSSAPRDPGYPENYCVSPSTWAGNPSTWGCIGATCEPAYHFPSVTSPNCEGWVKSQDGNATHSIAGLAHSAKQCTESVGGDCTIDMVDYWATPTDPYSKGWPDQFANKGGAPGGPAVLVDAANVITAGCDLAAATGGTWDGPSFATCPDGTSGSLQYVDHGPYDKPTTTNPTLFSALKNIGFGPVTKTQVAAGTGKPIFTYVPFGNIEPSPTLSPTSSCTRGGEPFPSCQQTPTVVHQNGLVYLGWNWSTNSTANVMYVGDSWSASFNVIAVGPPYSLVPVDACTTTDCKAVGSGSIDGLYTWASYVPASNDTVVTQSFPVAELRIQLAPLAPVGTTAPPPPPTPPAVPIPTAPPLPVVQQIGVGNTVGVAQVSLQAAAAGFLGAGFMRVGIKNRPIALRVAAKQSNASFQSKFDAGLSSQGGGVGRFE